jgi:hypothetical protein
VDREVAPEPREAGFPDSRANASLPRAPGAPTLHAPSIDSAAVSLARYRHVSG